MRLYLLLALSCILMSACGGSGSSDNNTSTAQINAPEIKKVVFELLPTTYNGTYIYSPGYQITVEYSGTLDVNTSSFTPPLALTLENYSSGNSVKKTFPSYNGLGANKSIRFQMNGDIGTVTGRSFHLTLTDRHGNDSNPFVYSGAIPSIPASSINSTTTTGTTTSPVFNNMSTLSILPVAGAADFIPSMTFCTATMNKAYTLYGNPDTISTNESIHSDYTYYNTSWTYNSLRYLNFSWDSRGNSATCNFNASTPSTYQSVATSVPATTILLKGIP